MTRQRPYTWCFMGKSPPYRLCLMVLLFHIPLLSAHSQTNVFDTRISLVRQQSSIYGLLSQISRQTGYFFIYDSEIINNDQRIRIAETTGDLRSVLSGILNDPTLVFENLGNHILIHRPKPEEPETLALKAEEPPEAAPIIVMGRVLDQETGSPLPYATILLENKGMGTTSNKDGRFHFRLPAEGIMETLRISYMGYKSQTFPLALINGKNIDVVMEADYISMQEVIIRYYDPEEIVKEALAKRLENFSNKPVYHTSFYREGVQRNQKLLNYSEAIFKVFKPAYNDTISSDQAVLLKSRKVSDVDQTDTLLLKIKAGVRSALELDIVRTMPAFLDMAFLHEVEFSHVDILTKDSRTVYAIGFEQTNQQFLPLFTGILYIDQENLAIIGADFEVHPKFIDKSTHIFVSRLDRAYHLRFNRIHYTVSYQYHNGKYHLGHLRGDLDMRFRQKNRLFGNNYHAFLEMVVCHIEENEVSRFRRRETFKTQSVFIDQDLEYDFDFWGNYNIIPPEKNITEAFSQIQSKIESMVASD